MNTKKNLITAFTEMAPLYEEKVDGELQRFMGWSYEEFIHILLDHACVLEHDKVLDIATGTSLIPRTMVERGKQNGQIVGLDLTPAMLVKAKSITTATPKLQHIELTCGSALELPFRTSYFDVVTCGLASHHMHVRTFVDELFRVLRPGGTITVADVSAPAFWSKPLVVPIIRVAALVYFLPTEGFARALAEASALSNIYTATVWREVLAKAGFTSIQITVLSKTHFWSPIPLILQATKPK